MIPNGKASKNLLLIIATCMIHLRTSGFKWGPLTQQSEVIDVVLGEDVTLPCDFVLWSTEEQQMATFFMITWTRVNPAKSNIRATLAVNSSDYGIKIFQKDNSSLSLDNNALVIRNINKTDDGLYRCALRAIFFSEPRTLKLNVQYKPDTVRMYSPRENSIGNPVVINCSCQANPQPMYNLYRGSKLVHSSKSGVYNIANYQPDDAGDYYCVAINIVGSTTSSKYTMYNGESGKRPRVTASRMVVAGISIGSFIAGAALICIVGLGVIFCRKRRIKIINDPVKDDQMQFEMRENPTYHVDDVTDSTDTTSQQTKFPDETKQNQNLKIIESEDYNGFQNIDITSY